MSAAYLRFICPAISGVLVLSAMYGQSTAPATQFEAATISVFPQDRMPRGGRGPWIRNGRYEIRAASIVDLIGVAYKVDIDRVYGGPSWLDSDRFDIAAKVTGKPSAESTRTMLQALLADRFQLVVREDTKPMPAYLLIATKKLNLRKTEGTGEVGCKTTVQMPQQIPENGGPIQPTFVLTCRSETMADFLTQARFLPGQAGGSRSIIDKTGLEGAWDFEFKYAAAVNGVTSGQTGIEALEKQVGLKMEQGTAPMDVVSVENVIRTPTPDPPGAVEVLKASAPPAEFEVADIKPSDPTSQRMSWRIMPGGRLNASGMSMAMLIQQAYDLRSPDMIADAPDWFTKDRYDIIAKAPASAIQTDLNRFTSANQNGPSVDSELIWNMVQSLLKDRFKLLMHQEDRPGTGHTLVATGRPKLKKADPNSRSKWSMTPVNAKDAAAPRSMQWIFHNTTMAQFAARLQQISQSGPMGQITRPVLDATGLEGGYDFTVTYSMYAGMPGGGRGAPTKKDGAVGPAPTTTFDPGLEASDPNGGLTLQEAIEKQLGLKLETQKRPVPTWVIDHIDRKPTDN